ncbi:MAG: uncharacterized protein A8A55_1409 [Amphiamblys sp. WSBS2006]|nr:MAG: uncharacterized protein A8A55_1409 [Amphiamblys sp. WSBS2006]
MQPAHLDKHLCLARPFKTCLFVFIMVFSKALLFSLLSVVFGEESFSTGIYKEKSNKIHRIAKGILPIKGFILIPYQDPPKLKKDQHFMVWKDGDKDEDLIDNQNEMLD